MSDLGYKIVVKCSLNVKIDNKFFYVSILTDTFFNSVGETGMTSISLSICVNFLHLNIKVGLYLNILKFLWQKLQHLVFRGLTSSKPGLEVDLETDFF